MAKVNPPAALPDSFEYVDLESVVGTNMISHRREKKSSAPSRAQRLAVTGDIFYQTVRPYQKNNYLFEKPDKDYVFSTGYAQLRPSCNGYYLFSSLQRESFVNEVLDHCTGTSYPAISAKDLAALSAPIPASEKEQRQIGAFFQQLDSLITLHQRKRNTVILASQVASHAQELQLIRNNFFKLSNLFLILVYELLHLGQVDFFFLLERVDISRNVQVVIVFFDLF